MNGIRIVEAIIVAIVGGLLAGYISVRQMEVNIIAIKEDISKIEKKVDIIDDRVYRHMIKDRQ